ncbi:MAG: ABC transporter permease [Acidobacteriota bacterium]
MIRSQSIELIVEACHSLRRTPLRTALTVLGVSVGLVTLLTIVSLLQGLTESFKGLVEALGSNTIFITKYEATFLTKRTMEERQRPELTKEDAAAIQEEIAGVAEVSPIREEQRKSIRVKEREVENVTVLGVMDQYQATSSHYVRNGRFISGGDEKYRTNVATIGSELAKTLFGNDLKAIGGEISIDGYLFLVVGVMEPLGRFLNQSMDMTVYVPLSTIEKFFPKMRPWTGFGHPESSFSIIIKPVAGKDVSTLSAEIRELLRRRRGLGLDDLDNFGIATQDALLRIYADLTSAAYLALTAISAVSLLIGGIGLMNIMLISVSERTVEIGLRKAVGASQRQILHQFLAEAVMVTLSGGVIGIFLSEASAAIVRAYSPLPAEVPAWAIGLGISVSAFVGLAFGVIPAWRAARLDPIEALHRE